MPQTPVNYKTVERPLNTLTFPKEVRGFYSLLLASDTYDPIDVNILMEGFQAMDRHMFMDKVKGGLSAPFQLWSWKKGGSSGVSTYLLLAENSAQGQPQTQGRICMRVYTNENYNTLLFHMRLHTHHTHNILASTCIYMVCID